MKPTSLPIIFSVISLLGCSETDTTRVNDDARAYALGGDLVEEAVTDGEGNVIEETRLVRRNGTSDAILRADVTSSQLDGRRLVEPRTYYRTLNAGDGVGTLRRYNNFLAVRYRELGKKYRSGGASSNFLVFAAAIGAVIDNPSADVTRATNALIGIRALEEFRTYVSPKEASRAFFQAAREAECINDVTYVFPDLNENDRNTTIQMLRIMRKSEDFLRKRLERKDESFFSIVGRIIGSDNESEGAEEEQEIANDAADEVEIATAKKSTKDIATAAVKAIDEGSTAAIVTTLQNLAEEKSVEVELAKCLNKGS